MSVDRGVGLSLGRESGRIAPYRPPLQSAVPLTRHRSKLSDDVAARLRDLIMSGQYRAGHHLRVEHLAAAFGVSVTPVREALFSLRGDGFVRLEPFRGFVVAPLSRQDLADLFVVHGQLAGELGARAARVVTDVQVAHLTELQRQLVVAAGEGRCADMEALNYQLHRTINKIDGSTKISLFLTQAVRYAPREFWQNIAGWPQASIDDHEPILAGLRARSPDVVRAAVIMHVEHTGRLLAEHLEAIGLWEPTGE